MITVHFIFWLCTALVFHSYVIYPLILKLLVKGKPDYIRHSVSEPDVYILMAVYNAGNILEDKISSVLNSDYPLGKIHFLIGSDCSTDATNDILRQLAEENPQLDVTYFNERTGKINIINHLYEKVKAEGKPGALMISTDVTAMFDKSCIKNLVKHFDDEKVAAVGANIIKRNLRTDGISGQEKAYYDRELLMKEEEGRIWGTAIGVFGACYAIRQEAFTKVPSHFLVDDFFITMSILSGGQKVLYDMDAIVYMNLANESGIEFRRKVRISAGNFQNLCRFWTVLLRFNGLSFAFLSHKVLRWLGPFFMLTTYLSSFLLMQDHWVYACAFFIQSVLFFSPLFNSILEYLSIHNKLIKFVSHFYLMNLGMLFGFFRFLVGIRSSVWEPTKR